MVTSRGEGKSILGSGTTLTPSVSRSSTSLIPGPPETNFTWIDHTHTSSASGGRRGVRRIGRHHDKVRKHAATVSAATRLATIRRKLSEVDAEIPDRGQDQLRQHSSVAVRGSAQKASPHSPHAQSWYIPRLLGEQAWRQDAIRCNTVYQKSTRALLWNSVTSNAALWQSAYLVSGTYSNSCGQPASAIHGIGSGLIYLRGKALEAIHASIALGTKDHLTCVAIAMLAAWERRFGDPETYQVHMNAWKRSDLPPSALEESNVGALMDAIWIAFREQLEERSAEPNNAVTKHRYHYPAHLPIGFRRFPLNRPETRSLLHLVAQYAKSSPEAPDGVARSRQLRIENMAWSPSHTISHNPGDLPCIAYEETWDGEELWALYHIRAALVSLTGNFGIAAHSAHRVHWTGDIAPGLEVHTNNCRHLRTEDLMGGKYREIALWAQFTMCSISRVASRDDQLRRWIWCCGISSWPEMQALLERHSHPEPILGEKTESLYRLLMDS